MNVLFKYGTSNGAAAAPFVWRGRDPGFLCT